MQHNLNLIRLAHHLYISVRRSGIACGRFLCLGRRGDRTAVGSSTDLEAPRVKLGEVERVQGNKEHGEEMGRKRNASPSGGGESAAPSKKARGGESAFPFGLFHFPLIWEGRCGHDDVGSRARSYMLELGVFLISTRTDRGGWMFSQPQRGVEEG